MIDYLYDGTFDGLLTCVFAHYYEEKAAGIFPRESYQSTMLGGYREIEAEEEKALRVYRAIEDKISLKDMARIYRVFLSNDEGKETKILRYIILGFKEGPKVGLLHGNPTVYEMQQTERKVTGEVHRLAGLLRFTVLKGDILYAPIEPDHDIVELLSNHFCERFKHDPFIIHDKKREKALIAKEGDWYVTELKIQSLPERSEDDEQYRKLWRKYFGTIAIKERTNPRCQKNFMPVRYWKYLTEMQI